MSSKYVWLGIVAVTAFAAVMAIGLLNQPVQSAESELPGFVVGDSYAFVGLEGGVISGPIVSVGPYPWVEMKVDGNDANVYFVNMKHVERIKHLQ